jgi:hypothetical protein
MDQLKHVLPRRVNHSHVERHQPRLWHYAKASFKSKIEFTPEFS